MSPDGPGLSQETADHIMEFLKRLTGAPVVLHPVILTVAGSLAAGQMLTQALLVPKEVKNEGWFTLSREEWQKLTYLGRYEQEDARRTLKKRGLMEERRSGLPAKVWYRVNDAELLRAMLAYNPMAPPPDQDDREATQDQDGQDETGAEHEVVIIRGPGGKTVSSHVASEAEDDE